MKGTCTKLFFLCLLGWLWLPAHQSTAQSITTVAGNGNPGGGGDGYPAIFASVKSMGVEADGNGNTYLADTDHNRIRKVDALTGVITTVAGSGTAAYSGDNGLATAAALRSPYDVAVAPNGDLYIADYGNHRIRKVDAVTKIITTIAGNGFPGSSGDGGAAGAARIYSPAGIVLDAAGNLYFTEFNGNRIRKVAAQGGVVQNTSIITTVAGTGTFGFLGDNDSATIPATSANMKNPWGLALDASGDQLYFADLNNYRIRRVKLSTNQIKTVAGTGTQGFSGDGGLATSARISSPVGLAISSSGNIYFSERDGNRIRKVNAGNAKISTIAGSLSGGADWTGDGGPAVNALLSAPAGLEVDGDGNIFVADFGNARIRRIEGFINNSLALEEGAWMNLSNPVLEFSNTTQPPASITYTLSSSVSNGTLFKDDNGDNLADAAEVLAAASTFTQADINADLIKYQHDGGENELDSFGFSVTDNAGKSLAGQTFVFNITKVNDEPVISYAGAASLSTQEDNNLLVPGLQMSDAEAGNDMVILYLLATNGKILIRTDVPGGVSSGQIIDNNNDSTSLTLMTYLPAINATLAAGDGLVFKPDTHFNGTAKLELLLNDNASASSGAGGAKTASFARDMDVTPVNDVPVITSDGGGAMAALAMDENTTAVTTVTATDVANEGSTLSFSISGGADQALFIIDPATGALGFASAPAFRLPADADANNTYEVTVRVTDDGAPTPVQFDEQTITVTVLDKTPPRVSSIVRLSPTDATTKVDPVVFRVTFDESVSNVDGPDFTLTTTGSAAGSVSAVSASSGTQMDVTVSGVSGDGTLRLDVNGSGTGIEDPAGLDLAEAFASGEAYTIDNTAPVITGVENGQFYGNDRTLGFNEGTATLNGSAFANNTLVGDEGHHTLVVTDVAGNISTLSFDIDKTAPTGTLAINGDAAQANQTGVSLALTTADGLGSQTAEMRLSHDNSTWTAWEPYAASRSYDLPAGDGLKTVYVQLRDAVGNVSASISDQINLDQTLPTVLLASATRDSVNAPFPVTITFSEDVTGFVSADLVVTNGTASDFNAVDAKTYTVLITPASEGWAKVAIPADLAQDIAANGNEAAETLIRLFDATRPSLAISGPAADHVNAAFTATFTFSEPVSGFSLGEVVVGNGSASAFTPVSATVYTALITPAADGLVMVDVADNVAVDPAANGNTAASPLSRTFDGTRPAVAITTLAPDPAKEAFTAVFTFSEPVSGFTAGDVQVGNGSVSGFLAQSATVYTALITPSADGLVTVAVAANVAADAAANGNEAAAALSRTYDATRPVVALAAAPANPVNAAFVATITFSEPVSGFDVSDIEVTNGTASGFLAQSATVYTAVITPSTDGLVKVAVAANVAADAAANGNEAAATLSRDYDATSPAVAISAPVADPVNAAFAATFTFSEPVSGFTAGDIEVGNGTVSDFLAQSATVYTALITPSADGLVTVAVAANVAADAAANGNQAAATLSRNYDAAKPALAIATDAAAQINAAFTTTFTFSEPVSGFTVGDIEVSNGTASGFTAQSATVYTALITPSADGLVKVAVAANLAADAALNGNEAAATLSRSYDGTSPAVAISAPVADPVNAAFTAVFTFSEPVSGFVAGDIQVGNGTVSGFLAQSTTVYTALITPSADGLVTVAVAANAAADAAANGNQAAATLSRNYDATKPALAITTDAAAQVNAAFTATFTFSEPVSGFTVGDIEVSNGSVSGFLAQGATVYTALITPSADGLVTVAVAANVAADAAANGNQVAATLSRTYDATQPAVTLASTAAAVTNGNPIPVSIHFSEGVAGFVAADITVSNGVVSGFTAVDAQTYQALISPLADGQVSVQVTAQVAADAAGNANTASNQVQHLFDASRPQVVIASQAPAWVNAPFPVSFTFTEPVADFSAADITAVNASISDFTALSATQYTATVNPVAAGLASVSVGANKASDAAANGNQASQVLSRNYDAAQPAVTLASATAQVLNAPFSVQISFSEAVTGFDQADIAVSNGQASAFTQISNSAYSALITPAGEGLVQVQVAAASASDLAGNASQASNELARTFDGTRPAVVLTSPVAAVTSVNPIPVSIAFSEAVADFVLADVTVTGGTVTGFSGSGKDYSLLVTPGGDGVITVQVNAGVAQDMATNGNLASNMLSRTFDGSRPSLLITAQTDELSRLPFTATFTFSESVTGFVSGDVGITNATVSNFQSLSASVYTALITPAPLGTILVKVAENVAFDQLQNGNLAATPLIVEDIRCGNSREKVLICHKGQMICVSLNALQGHLGHGDNIGSCNTSSNPNARTEFVVKQAEQGEVEVYPNPAKVKTNIEFMLVEAGSYRLALYDLKGTLVTTIAAGQGESSQFISQQLDVSAYPQGVYLVRLTTQHEVVTKRLLIEK